MISMTDILTWPMPMGGLLQVRMLPRQLLDHLFQMLSLIAFVLQHFRPFVALTVGCLQIVIARLLNEK